MTTSPLWRHRHIFAAPPPGTQFKLRADRFISRCCVQTNLFSATVPAARQIPASRSAYSAGKVAEPQAPAEILKMIGNVPGSNSFIFLKGVLRLPTQERIFNSQIQTEILQGNKVIKK